MRSTQTDTAACGPGILFLVVGPSGAGKDTLISGARRHLGDDGRFRFPARFVTRPAAAGDEQHRPLSPAEFRTALAAGRFALHWSAHGLQYGIGVSIDEDLGAGRSVVCNVSRTVLPTARRLYARCLIVHVTAPAETLENRLIRRGRESADDIVRRLTRSRSVDLNGFDVLTVHNDGTPEEGVRRFVRLLLKGVKGSVRPASR